MCCPLRAKRLRKDNDYPFVNGLIPHYYEGKLSGHVSVDGVEIKNQQLSKISQHVGSVFQNPRSQFFNVDTTSELAFGCENQGLPKEDVLRRIAEAANRFSLNGLLNRSIFELSGGRNNGLHAPALCSSSGYFCFG